MRQLTILTSEPVRDILSERRIRWLARTSMNEAFDNPGWGPGRSITSSFTVATHTFKIVLHYSVSGELIVRMGTEDDPAPAPNDTLPDSSSFAP